MLVIEEKEMEKLLEKRFQEGVRQGVKLMQQKMLAACENGTPINIEERAYFVRSDLQNLRDIFEDLEAERG